MGLLNIKRNKTISNKKSFQDFCRIQDEIEKAKLDIEDAYSNFQNVSDPDLIDCYIYQGNAAWKRYLFLLRQAKLL